MNEREIMVDSRWACPWCEQLNGPERDACSECGCWKSGMASAAEMSPPAPQVRPPAQPPREWTLLELLEAAFLVLGWTVAGFIPMSLVFAANFTTPQPEPWISIASAIALASMLLGPVIGIRLVAQRWTR